MKTIHLFSLILTVLSLGLAFALVTLQDPLVRQCRMLRARLSLAKESRKPNLYLADSGRLLDRAEHCLRQSRELQSRIHSHTGGPAPQLSEELMKECDQMQREITRLRAEARQLLADAAFALNLQPAVL